MHGTFEMLSSMEPFLGKDTVRCREFVQSVCGYIQYLTFTAARQLCYDSDSYDITAGGGEMIAEVFNEKSTYAEPPSR